MAYKTKFTKIGLPKDADDWTVEDWRELFEGIEHIKARIAARHGSAIKTEHNAVSESDRASGCAAFVARLKAQLARRVKYYRTKQDDPYNINTALYVAMSEVEHCIGEASKEKPHNKQI